MRADRLLSLLMLLQTRGQMSAQALADELEVSERTIYRDITAFPPRAFRSTLHVDQEAGVRSIDEYRTTLTGLTPDEDVCSVHDAQPRATDAIGNG